MYNVLMQKIFLILSLFFLLIPRVNAATIVYPKSQNVTINSACTFFIGNEDVTKILTINGEKVDVYKTGAFKHSVNLEYGENVFEIDNGIEMQIYKINRGETPVYKPDTNEFAKLTENENKTLLNELKGIKSNSEINITIDAGHGGKEYGAIGCLCEKEKDINLQIAKKLKMYLEDAGYSVFMTRENDSYIGLRDRVDFSNKNNTHIFISIHANALPDSRAKSKINGSEVYYLYPQSKAMAQSILNSLSKYTGLTARGVYQRNFAVVRNPNAISVLVEVGYIIDPEDEEKLINSDFQNTAAKAIMQGMENYLNGI